MNIVIIYIIIPKEISINVEIIDGSSKLEIIITPIAITIAPITYFHKSLVNCFILIISLINHNWIIGTVNSAITEAMLVPIDFK